MPSLFVVTKSGYEYNDETYTRSQGGVPLRVWASEEVANKDCLKQNIKKLRDIDPRQYCESLEDILKKDLIRDLVNNYNIVLDDDQMSFKHLPDEILTRILTEGKYESNPFVFFDVYEVEMGR